MPWRGPFPLPERCFFDATQVIVAIRGGAHLEDKLGIRQAEDGRHYPVRYGRITQEYSR
jgi:hypothetical protein